ncbi:hypothetical protein MJ391_16880 [Escherichia coli]|nr:hypothetical protein MJ391_16880 [Escherichia coli]
MKWSCRGAVNPDEFYVHKPTLAAGIARLSCVAPWGRKRSAWFTRRPRSTASRLKSKTYRRRTAWTSSSLTNEEVQELAKQAVQIEKHYGRPMDIEWAKDGHTGNRFIVQARPETVRSRGQVMERYTLHSQGKIIAEGRAIGHRIMAPVR